MDAAQVELIEKIEIEVGEIADGIEPCRHVRLAKAGMLRHNDVEFFSEARHGGKPNADAATAMKKDEGGAGPPTHETDAAIADGQGRDRMGGHSSRSLSLAAELR
jgi:hypothetical protein